MKRITELNRLDILQKGLCVPLVTPFDKDGKFLPDDFHALMEYVLQNGLGGNVFFINGTTGEFNYIDNITCKHIIHSAVEFKKSHATHNIRIWCGISGNTTDETLENLDFALKTTEIDAVVIAPLYFMRHDQILKFFRRDVRNTMEKHRKFIPIFLYDNKDILSPCLKGATETPLEIKEISSYLFRILLQHPKTAYDGLKDFITDVVLPSADPEAKKKSIHQIRGYLRTREVKYLSRLEYIVGIKVTAPIRIIGNYIRASGQFGDLGTFGIYIGNAPLIFDIFKDRIGLGRLIKWWEKFILRATRPHGVVSGSANVMPREWSVAWDAALNDDYELADSFRKLFQEYRALCSFNNKRKSIACAKWILYNKGIISSPFVIDASKRLSENEIDEIRKRYANFEKLVKDSIPFHYHSLMMNR